MLKFYNNYNKKKDNCAHFGMGEILPPNPMHVVSKFTMAPMALLGKFAIKHILTSSLICMGDLNRMEAPNREWRMDLAWSLRHIFLINFFWWNHELGKE